MRTNHIRERIHDDLESITEQICDGIERGKFTLHELQDKVLERTKQAAQATDDYVHENSWKTIGIVAAVGVLVGFMMNRR